MTTSHWALPMPTFEPLGSDVQADVVVVGGGVAGLTTAVLLARAGRSVVLLERDELGSGETTRTSAHSPPAWTPAIPSWPICMGRSGRG